MNDFARTRLSLVAAVMLGVTSIPPAAAVGQAPAEEAPATTGGAAPAAEAGPLTDPAELEAFIDGMMAAHFRSGKIPAATISVVEDGELFFAKGYGFADREKRIPVAADKTLFRPGSISKLFTWTAVMQLAERGELDLDADVNTYLDGFEIPATFPEPITMRHLLAHTPGFEEGALGYLFVENEDGLVPLRESLAAHVPDRVRPPGTWPSYSNFGTALAGLVVENVSGMLFADYVEANVFEPLSMERSTFREPLPEDLAAEMAVGYKRENGLYEAGPFELIGNFGPAGSLTSTATDMARFMIAHLQLGRFGDQRILEEATARRMHSQLHTSDPRLPGMAYGFYESEYRGERIIGHGGDTLYFHSDLVLLPEHDVGLFVSYVGNGGFERWELVDAFVERYFATELAELPEPSADFAERGQRFAGQYRFTRHNSSDIEKIMALFNVLSVAITPDGTLAVSGFFEEPLHFVEVEPLFFRQIDGPLSLAFTEDGAGEVTHMIFSNLPFMPTYRIAWYTAPAFNYFLLGIGLLLCITVLVSAFRHRRARKHDPAVARWAVRIAASVAVLTVVFFVAVVVILSSSGLEELMYGFPPSLTAALMLPILATILSLAVVAFAVLAWKNRFWSRFQRIHYTLFAVFAVGLVWFYWYWNLLGVQYG
jgi:CubicO group peptidase (beta-lactamase class C family)